MILLRLSPLIPYNALDYMSGVTSISFWAYALALIGILPGTIMFVYVGATASSLADSASTKNKTVQIITMVMGIFFAFCGVYVASYYSKRELDRVSIKRSYRKFRKAVSGLLIMGPYFFVLRFSHYTLDLGRR